MKKLLLILIVSCSSFIAKSQTLKSESNHITKDSLINNYTAVLTKGNNNILISFKVAAFTSPHLLKEILSKTGELTDDQIGLIRQVDIGAELYFGDIEFKNTKGEKELIKGLTFIIKK